MKKLKKKKAFTLIELLAVIIILGVLSVLIIPKVLTSIDESEKNANLASVKNIVKTAELKIANNEVTGNTENKTINYTTGENVNYLDFSGEKPEKGLLDIKNGQIALAIKIGDNCYLKSYDSEDITYISYDESTCGHNSNVFVVATPQSITYTVTFNVYSGSSVPSQTIEIGQKAIEPTSPTKEGYTFGGWYLDGEFTQPYDFENEVMDDVTLHAKWIEIAKTTYTVSFNSNGGSNVSSQTIEENHTAAQPTNPTRSGYDFSGWYSDSGLTQSFNFNTAITNNITLYAKWTQVINNYTVTFNTMGGNSISSQAIEHGGKATRPSDPTRSGYEFTWWYTDPYTQDYSTRYSFNTAVTSNITLYAGWNRVYTVSYVTNGDRERSDDLIREGHTIDRTMCSLYKRNYYFLGWYTNSGLTNQYVYSTPVTSDITLYGKWQALPSSGSSFTFTVEGTQFTTTYGTTWAQFVGNGKSVNGGTLIVDSDDDLYVIYDQYPTELYEITSYDECPSSGENVIKPGDYIGWWPLIK